MERVAAVLLAGGLARRMGGGDKPLRLLGGRTLLDHVVDRVRPQVSAMALNANGDPARFAAWGLPVLPDPVPGHPGPLAGILAGMRWAATLGMAHVLSVPTDTPFLPADLAARLAGAAREAGVPIACAASFGRTHPVVAIWPAGLADALEQALLQGTRKIDAWTATLGCVAVDFGPTGCDSSAPDPFANANTPEDLRSIEDSCRPGHVAPGGDVALS